MGLFGFLKKKKKTEYEEVEQAVNFESEQTEALEKVDFFSLSKGEQQDYVNSLYDNIREIEENNVMLKEEYKAVSAYLSDIQLIDTMPEEDHERLVKLAKHIHNLAVDRKIYQTTESKISNDRYINMQYYEKEVPEAITNMTNDEKYLQMVTRDLKIIESEKFALRQDAKSLHHSQNVVNQVTLIAFLSLVTVAVVYLLLGAINPGALNETAFLAVLLVALVLVTITFVIAQRIKYNIKLTQMKLNKAITLQNKVKIKFINATNSIDYAKAKYNVENAYQLSRLYELYLEAKKENEHYRRTATELNTSMDRMLKLLAELDLYDVNIWQNEIRALIDPREMVEVRHRLNQRRQKLRTQLEENAEKIRSIEFSIKVYQS